MNEIWNAVIREEIIRHRALGNTAMVNFLRSMLL